MNIAALRRGNDFASSLRQRRNDLQPRVGAQRLPCDRRRIRATTPTELCHSPASRQSLAGNWFASPHAAWRHLLFLRQACGVRVRVYGRNPDGVGGLVRMGSQGGACGATLGCGSKRFRRWDMSGQTFRPIRDACSTTLHGPAVSASPFSPHPARPPFRPSAL